jgi:hypothetical protein
MVERQRQDSSRDLLEELEDGWAAPPPLAPSSVLAREPSPSSPDVEALDKGWLDDLFPSDEDGDEDDPAEEEEEEDEPEPELPDERLDPEAFALAKKAREERAAKKKEKKRAKLEAKRTRQKARAAASRQKQKPKKSRSSGRASERTPPLPRAAQKNGHARTSNGGRSHDAPSMDDEPSEIAIPGVAPVKPHPKTVPAKRASTLASSKLLAIVLGVLLSLAALVAAIVK